MQRTRWVDRSFNFDFPEGLLPNVIERLSGTTIRMAEMTNGISDSDLSLKPEGKWSIKEQIGHLVDLEDLHISRLKEMIARKPELTPADMQNVKTEQADHNNTSVSVLIESFDYKRNEFVNLLRSMDDETQLFSSLHTRLNIRMRPVDIAFFTAEHDDHHLTSVREIINGLAD